MPQAPRPHQARQSAKRIDRRLPASQRGYDRRWARLRDMYARQHPLCVACWARDRIARPLDEVDHVIPIIGPDDPLRLDDSNLQSLCRSHHATKTQHDDTIRAEYERLAATHGHDAAAEAVADRWKTGGMGKNP